jgi:FkbM family methyltransferase
MVQALHEAGASVLAFADNNRALHGLVVNGVKVESVEGAIAKYRADAVFVVSVYTRKALSDQLRALGVSPASAAAVLFHIQSRMLPHASVDWPDRVLASGSAVLHGGDQWADEASRNEYLRQIRWRLALEDDIPPGDEPSNTYFAPDLSRPSPTDHFVDCGAFDGDTVRAILNHSGGRFRAITAIEPDPDNCRRLRQFVAQLPTEQQGRINISQAALADQPRVARFAATSTAGSALDGDGTYEVQCARLDDLLAESQPTFIKMDVEGAEIPALRGACRILREDQPRLAICLYHDQGHLWEIPNLIRSLNPRYKLFLRRYSDDCWETVCYALPA